MQPNAIKSRKRRHFHSLRAPAHWEMLSFNKLKCPQCPYSDTNGTCPSKLAEKAKSSSGGVGLIYRPVCVAVTPEAALGSLRPHPSRPFSRGREPGPSHMVWISIPHSSLCWQQTFPCQTCTRPYTSSHLPYSPPALVKARRLYLYSYVSASRDCVPLCPHHSSPSRRSFSSTFLSPSLSSHPPLW